MNRSNVALFVVLVLVAGLTVAGFTMLGKNRRPAAPAEVAAAQPPAEEPAKEEEPEAAPQVQTQPRQQRNGSRQTDLNSGISRIVPMQDGQGLPTKEEAVDFAYDVIDRYRNGTPEEKERIRAGAERAANYLNGVSANAGRVVEGMNAEQRQRLVERLNNSQEILSALQQEMTGVVTEDEISTFGGVYMALRNATQSLLNATR